MEQESPLLQPAYNADASTHETESAKSNLASQIAASTGLRASPHQYKDWLGIELPTVPSAIWLMRALVATNVLSRREDKTLFLPDRPPPRSNRRKSLAITRPPAQTRRLPRHPLTSSTDLLLPHLLHLHTSPSRSVSRSAPASHRRPDQPQPHPRYPQATASGTPRRPPKSLRHFPERHTCSSTKSRPAKSPPRQRDSPNRTHIESSIPPNKPRRPAYSPRRKNISPSLPNYLSPRSTALGCTLN